MDEEEFDSLVRGRPFGTADTLQAETRARRSTALGIALFGKNPDGLYRQLMAPHPEIPSGFELAEFRDLQRSTLEIAARLNDPRQSWISTSATFRELSLPNIVIGTRHLTVWEARCEIVRRAIEYLENR